MIFSSLFPASLKERLRRRAGAVTMSGRLENLRRAGFRPRRIIDAGAFRGDWARMAARIFPEASLLLIEPQPHLQSTIAACCASLPSARFRSALLGRTSGTACFLIDETNSRIVASPTGWAPDKLATLPIEPLSKIAGAEGFADCDFLKLDLQGHELEALAGAGSLFGQTEIIQIEASWLPIGPVPLAPEIVATMVGAGYRLYDVMGFNYRPLDGALWQTDFLFVRADSALLARQQDWS